MVTFFPMSSKADSIENPRVRKARVLHGRSLSFRNATVSDAEFILALRTNNLKSRYLNTTSTDIESQRAWLRNYAASDDQAYFMIESAGNSIGTVRLYGAQGNSFCWGSWILAAGAPSIAAIESALIVYAYALDHLGFKAAHFEVRKDNRRVRDFHERFGAICTHEAKEESFYEISCAAIQQSRKRFARFLPHGISFAW